MTRRCLLLAVSLVLNSVFAMAGSRDASRIGRISFLEGHVSFQHGKGVDWSAASINMALQPADRIYTGEDGRAEIQFDDGSILRLAEKTDIEILAMKEDFIQIRILLGLTTLTVQSGVGFELNTPAAAFNTIRKGVYRFDIQENGDTDAIVRKGLLDAANNSFSKRVESGELLHVTPGEHSTNTLARYDQRDEWDEWNDRRNADLTAYESKKYLPSYVAVGARELDRYGRWVVVEEYGPAWVPLYVNVAWTPYWYGRWCYRPFWGWTWVSYEPWGWLPYHYGRWYHSPRAGWCWLPGASFSFHFWSPGLVRFYHGPNWVSWCPLGPGDYYNVNNYFYNGAYNYHLNDLRLVQRRGPGDLINRNVPGAFRTARIDQFANESLGRGNRVESVEGGEQPWLRGRIVTEQLAIQPTARSYAPAPDRPSIRPGISNDRPVVVRTEPGMDASSQNRFLRITNPSIAPSRVWQELDISEDPGRQGSPSIVIGRGDSDPSTSSRGNADRRDSLERGPSIWRRGIPESRDSGGPFPGRIFRQSPGNSRNKDRGPGTEAPENHDLSPLPIPLQRRESGEPPVNRYERSVPPGSRPNVDRPPPEPARRPEGPSNPSIRYVPRHSPPNFDSGPTSRFERFQPPGGWRDSSSPRYVLPSWGNSGHSPNRGGNPMPSSRSGGSYSGGLPPGAPPAMRAPPQGGGPSQGAPSILRRRDTP